MQVIRAHMRPPVQTVLRIKYTLSTDDILGLDILSIK